MWQNQIENPRTEVGSAGALKNTEQLKLTSAPSESQPQYERLLIALEDGPQTTHDIFTELEICRPSARIYDLRQRGHLILTEKDNSGEQVDTWQARYVLAQEVGV